MDTIHALKTRRSVRAYRHEPIPRETLTDLIDCARLAPTAINIQPWEFVVVTERETLNAIAGTTDHGRFIADATACVVVLCQNTKYFLEDGSSATLSILLAAHAHGLAGCWVAGDKKPYAAEVCRIVGAPANYRLISLVPIGYPAEQPEKEKRPLSGVLHWEKF
jgi:nitroreductase